MEPFGLPLQRSLDFALVFSLLAGRSLEDVNPELLNRYTKTFTLKNSTAHVLPTDSPYVSSL